jgi:hypothetical protein
VWNSGKPEFQCNPSSLRNVLAKAMDPRVKPAGDAWGGAFNQARRAE